MLAAAAVASPPPQTPVAPPVPAKAPSGGAPVVDPPGGGIPNEDLIEFLGADDVGDAAWWEFLRNSAPRKDRPSAPPPRDAQQ